MNIAALTFLKIFPLLKVKYQTDSRNWGFVLGVRRLFKVEPKEWDKLIELITVNETYFFREENLLEEFQRVILPKYQGRTPDNPLRIWSAACSSGEEPYTLAILIEESGLFEAGAVEIIGFGYRQKGFGKSKKGLV